MRSRSSRCARRSPTPRARRAPSWARSAPRRRPPCRGSRSRARHVESGLVRTAISDATGHFTLAALPVGTYEVRATLDGSARSCDRGSPSRWASPWSLSLTLVLGGAEDEITVTQEVGAREHPLRRAELPRLGGDDRDLPLNGRNYTDLALLQPGVIAFPYRDGGSVVAHGLAMSVNGQDPRSNVYLLDGTLHERLHQRPGRQRRRHGARHGDRARVPRRDQRLQRRVRPQRRRPDQRAHQVGHQRARAAAPTSSTATTRSTRATTSTSASKPDFTRNQFGGTARRPDARATGCSSSSATRGCARTSAGRSRPSCPTTTRARGVLPDPGRGTVVDAGEPARPPLPRRVPAANGADLGGGLARLHASRSTRRSTRTSSRAGSTTNLARHDQFFAPLHARRCRAAAADRLPAVPARVRVAQPVLHRASTARCCRPARWTRSRFGYQPHAHRPERRGQHVPAAAAVRARARVDGRHRHRRHAALRAAELGRRALLQNVFSLQRRPRAHARPPPAQGRRAWSSTTRPTWSTRRSASASTPSPTSRAFLANRAHRFIGLTPEGDIRSRLAVHAVRRSTCRTTPRSPRG